MSEIKAAIFDMDGLALDTEQLALECWRQAAEEIGLVFDDALWGMLVGRRLADSKASLFERHGPDYPVEELAARANALYAERLEVEPPKLKPGLLGLLDWLDARGWPTALATSTCERLARRKMEKAGLQGRFDPVVCGDMVEQGKPAPDIYLLAAKKLGVAPEACVAFEDSSQGARSALGAGMRVIVVPDILAPEPDVAERAAFVAQSLLEAPAWLAAETSHQGSSSPSIPRKRPESSGFSRS